MSEGSATNREDTSSSGEEIRNPTDPETISCDSSSIMGPRSDNCLAGQQETCIKIPIVGYEVMEQRAKFTVFKLRIEMGDAGDYYYVFRRYTDFVRLHSKLKSEHPDIALPLPKKKWFGDNFNPNFIEDRIDGLQGFVNAIVQDKTLVGNATVRDFFCLDEPPPISDNIEESKAVVEELEERIFRLQRQLKEKETAYERLQAAHSVEIDTKFRLTHFIQECTKQCSSCSARLSEISNN